MRLVADLLRARFPSPSGPLALCRRRTEGWTPDPRLGGGRAGQDPFRRQKPDPPLAQKSLSVPGRFWSVVPPSCRRPPALGTRVALPTGPGRGSCRGSCLPVGLRPAPPPSQPAPIWAEVMEAQGRRSHPLSPVREKPRESRPRSRWGETGLLSKVPFLRTRLPASRRPPPPCRGPSSPVGVQIFPQPLGDGVERMPWRPPRRRSAWSGEGPGGGQEGGAKRRPLPSGKEELRRREGRDRSRGEGKPAAVVRLRSAGGDGGVPPERRRPPVQRRRPRGPRRGEEAAGRRRGSQRDQLLWENPAPGMEHREEG